METADIFSRASVRSYDAGDPFSFLYGPHALLVCVSCGNREECDPSDEPGRVWPCSAECHLPRCPKCRQHVHDCGAEPRVMVRVESFPSDRLLPSGKAPSYVYQGDGSRYPFPAQAFGFTLTRPYVAHTKITAPPGDFRAERQPHDVLGHLYSKEPRERTDWEIGAELAAQVADRVLRRFRREPDR